MKFHGEWGAEMTAREAEAVVVVSQGGQPRMNTKVLFHPAYTILQSGFLRSEFLVGRSIVGRGSVYDV